MRTPRRWFRLSRRDIVASLWGIFVGLVLNDGFAFPLDWRWWAIIFGGFTLYEVGRADPRKA